MTFRQALALGAHVRKGEKGSTVVYANQIVRTESDDAGEEVEQRIPFLKAYTVFNVEQIDDLPDLYQPVPPESVNPGERSEAVERFFAGLGADVRHGGAAAYYVPASDHVQMPPFETFRDAGAYYATLGHECVHWAGRGSRLARDFSRSTQAYAREELVAELGAAFLCADLGLELEPREDHAAYLGHCLEVLKADKRFCCRRRPMRSGRLHGCMKRVPDGLTSALRTEPRPDRARPFLCSDGAKEDAMRDVAALGWGVPQSGGRAADCGRRGEGGEPP